MSNTVFKGCGSLRLSNGLPCYTSSSLDVPDEAYAIQERCRRSRGSNLHIMAPGATLIVTGCSRNRVPGEATAPRSTPDTFSTADRSGGVSATFGLELDTTSSNRNARRKFAWSPSSLAPTASISGRLLTAEAGPDFSKLRTCCKFLPRWNLTADLDAVSRRASDVGRCSRRRRFMADLGCCATPD